MNHKEVLQDCEREFSLTPTISQRKRSYQAAPRLNREMEELIFPRERFRFHLFHITCTCDAYCMCSCCIFCHHTFCRKKTITVENSVFETTTVKNVIRIFVAEIFYSLYVVITSFTLCLFIAYFHRSKICRYDQPVFILQKQFLSQWLHYGHVMYVYNFTNPECNHHTRMLFHKKGGKGP